MLARSLLLVALAAMVPVASHATTVLVPYSGQLAENGQLVNGTRSLQFSLYATPAGGSALATQTETLNLVRGVYHTQLSFDDTVWSLSEPRWIGVSVDAAPELEPRVALGFVPFAVRSLTSEQPQPGVNFRSTPGSTTTVPTQSTWTVLDTVGVTAPADGYLWLTATVRVNTLAPTQAFHDINIIMSETTPAPSPSDQFRVNEAMGPTNVRSYSHTQVLPVTAGHHTMGLHVRQVTNLGSGASTNFTRVTLQAMWLPRLYP